MNFAERVRGILFEPRAEWPRVAAEATTPQSLYTGYIMILAAIGPIALFVGLASLGFAFALRTALLAYVNSLVAVAVLALLVDVLAPSFGGKKDYLASLQLTAYSFTAVWVAEIALVVPLLGSIVALLAGIYGFYLFMLGAPVLKKSSADRAIPFTSVVLLCAIVLAYLIEHVLFGMTFSGGPMTAAGLLPLR